MKPKAIFFTLFLCLSVLIGGCAVTPPTHTAPPDTQPPAISPSPSSYTTSTAQITHAPAASDGPAQSDGVAPSPDTGLGIQLPSADAYGCRSYNWNGWKVEDWLGDNSPADKIRSLMLSYLTDIDPAEPEPVSKSLFLGIAQQVADGWVLPADLFGEGEWMPRLYYLLDNNGSLQINSVLAYTNVWELMRSRIPGREAGEYSLYYCTRPVPQNMNSDDGYSVTASFQEGSQVLAEFPVSYPYPLIVHTGASPILSFAFENAATGEAVSSFWELNAGDSAPDGNKPSICSIPMIGIQNPRWDEYPRLRRIDGGATWEISAPYQADLNNGTLSVSAYPPAPLDLLINEGYAFARITALPDTNIQFVLEPGTWGQPQALTATLFMPDQSSRNCTITDGVIDLGALNAGTNYLLHVSADFGDSGTIVWAAPGIELLDR